MNSVDVKGGNELAKGIGELIKSVGATDEQRQALGQTFFGTLLGQSVALLGMMLVYFGALAMIWQNWSEGLKAFHADLGGWFWLILAAPVICILLFSMLPTALRARRERRMIGIVDDAQLAGTHFRTYPYGAEDRTAFKRLDGADQTALNWLKSTETPLLYFSGASGVGKSSLLAACVLPQLRDAGWLVIETRLFGDPTERLCKALFAAETRLAKKDADLPLYDLFKKVADARKRKGEPPLLLVIDQFEEFLILYKDDERAAFGAFLHDLMKRPINGLRILLVFRSDYRALVFKLDLPPLSAAQNWHELAPYDRGEAAAFLRNGGRNLSVEVSDKLFRGLDRIEDAPGMYRLITLNMVGLVLERMGRTLEGDPGRLIQSYLQTCLTKGDARDFVKPLLANMITDAGTKGPRSRRDLAKITGFASWQVKSTLAELARQGLVRRLEATAAAWEVAHDFLARVIGQMIGRLKPNFFARAQPLIAPIALMGWIGLAALVLPGWQYKHDFAEWKLPTATHDQASQLTSLSVKNDRITNLNWLRCDFKQLSLAVQKVEDFEVLRRCNRLASLDLTGSNVTSLDALKDLKGLTALTLDLTDMSSVTSLDALKDLKGLTTLSLDLSRNSGTTSLDALKDLTGLSSLSLNLSESIITSLDALKDLKGLTTLSLNLSESSVRSFDAVKDLKGITTLSLNLSSSKVTSLDALKDLKGLTSLSLDSRLRQGLQQSRCSEGPQGPDQPVARSHRQQRQQSRCSEGPQGPDQPVAYSRLRQRRQQSRCSEGPQGPDQPVAYSRLRQQRQQSRCSEGPQGPYQPVARSPLQQGRQQSRCSEGPQRPDQPVARSQLQQ